MALIPAISAFYLIYYLSPVPDILLTPKGNFSVLGSPPKFMISVKVNGLRNSAGKNVTVTKIQYRNGTKLFCGTLGLNFDCELSKMPESCSFATLKLCNDGRCAHSKSVDIKIVKVQPACELRYTGDYVTATCASKTSPCATSEHRPAFHWMLSGKEPAERNQLKPMNSNLTSITSTFHRSDIVFSNISCVDDRIGTEVTVCVQDQKDPNFADFSTGILTPQTLFHVPTTVSLQCRVGGREISWDDDESLTGRYRDVNISGFISRSFTFTCCSSNSGTRKCSSVTLRLSHFQLALTIVCLAMLFLITIVCVVFCFIRKTSGSQNSATGNEISLQGIDLSEDILEIKSRNVEGLEYADLSLSVKPGEETRVRKEEVDVTYAKIDFQKSVKGDLS